MYAMKNMLSVCVAVLILTFSSHTFAASSSGSQVISKIRVYSSGVIMIWGETGDWKNLEGCTTSEAIVLSPEIDSLPNEYYSEMYALIASSYLQGKLVTARVADCLLVGTPSYPVIQSITSE